MISVLRSWLARSETFSFNYVLRDRFVAQEACATPAGLRVLDVGAGSCPYRPLFAHCDYKTHDAKPLEADQLRDSGYGRIDYVSDARSIPVPDASFELVLCTEMIEHHPEPIAVVREFGRILAPGGKLVVTAPLGSGLHQTPHHYYGGFTPYWYERFLGEAGFERIRVVPNGGGPRFLAQEAIRFVREWSPFRPNLPLGARLIWLPFWAVLLPILGMLLPFAARWLDRYDPQPQFTIGYHVTAIRSA